MDFHRLRSKYSVRQLLLFNHIYLWCISCWHRLFWYGIQLCALAASGYIFVYAFDVFSAKPTFTTLESVNYPVSELDFPAIAVCPVNKISKKAALEYAIEL